MARARWLKPEFFTDVKINALSDRAALVFQALWIESDDGGVARGDPRDIYGRCFIKRPGWSVETVEQAFGEIAGQGIGVFLEHHGERFVWLPNLMKNQGTTPKKWRHLGDDHAATIKRLEEVRTNGDSSKKNAVPTSKNAVLSTFTPKPVPEPVPEPPCADARVETEPAVLAIVRQSKARQAATAAVAQPNGKVRSGRDTWLTPLLDAWKARFRGEFQPGRLAKTMKPLIDEHGEQGVLARWRFYLADPKLEARYATPEAFARTFGQHDPDAPAFPGVSA